MQRSSIWTVSLAAALSLTGAAWAEHEGGGGHRPAGGHGTTPTFAKQRGSDEAHEARESHSGAKTSSAAGANSASRLMTRLMNDPTLSARLLALMPMGSTKTNLMNAAKGFRNLGQFIAALHAVKDLNDPKITLATLKAEMTGSDHDSLGQAIHELDPTINATTLKADVTKARQEARADLKADRAAEDKAEDAKEAAQEAAEDAKEATKEAAEEANEAAKTPTSGGTTGSTTAGSQTRP